MTILRVGKKGEEKKKEFDDSLFGAKMFDGIAFEYSFSHNQINNNKTLNDCMILMGWAIFANNEKRK